MSESAAIKMLREMHRAQSHYLKRCLLLDALAHDENEIEPLRVAANNQPTPDDYDVDANFQRYADRRFI
jgi:hypothetical protein